MSGKVSSVLLAICVLTVMVNAHGNITKEQMEEWTEKMAKAKCNVILNMTEEAVIYANCIQNLTGKEVPENQRENKTFYFDLKLSMADWKNVKDCARVSHGWQEEWSVNQALDFAANNMTFVDEETRKIFTEKIQECSTKYGTNEKEFTKCGKDVYLDVCYNITNHRDLLD